MYYSDQTINVINRNRLQLFTTSYLTAVGYLIATYLLLTVNNPFNFNNNFHLIGIISFLSFVVQFLLAILSGRLLQQRTLHNLNEDISSDDPFEGLSSFTVLLLMLFFTILSPLMYFLLINEFMLGHIKSVLFGLSGLFVGMIIFAYWIAIKAFFMKQLVVNWWSLINKSICLIIFMLIFTVIINFLTGIIPADIKPSSQSYFSL